MGATIKDVAREAGVSVATVSRVFNNSGPVREETRRLILEVARRLRYTPNGAARSLITRRTGTVGVVLPELEGEFFSEVIRGIDRTAQGKGYQLLLSGSHNATSKVSALQLMRGNVDGLIVMSPSLEARALAPSLPENVPVVLLNCCVEGSSLAALNIDNFGGAYAMVEHLVAVHGHRRVAIIKGPEENWDARERLRGYRAAMQALAGGGSEELEFPGDFTQRSGYAAAQRILELDPRPTAIFAANDSMAIGALSALSEAGVRVPEEVAIAGFDDIPIARYTNPPLSSVHVGIGELGARAMARLLEAIEQGDDEARRQEVLPTRCVLRSSCGCFRGEEKALR
ncbi:MAG TPA: LacI family DNA-binding transcriptional regulator [Longimicrobiales bacterium]